MWDRIHDAAIDWAPALVATAVGMLVVSLAHRILKARSSRSTKAERGLLSGPLLTFLLAVIVVIGVVLLLPIGDSARGQLLGLLGLLATAAIALSSTTFVGNAMAGLMLRSVRNFKPGDFVRVDGHLGRVSEQGLLHTEIQTEDRDLTTLPNLYLVTHPVTVMRSSGTVVSATVSLGYDVGHEQVQPLLLAAAARADLTDAFVQVSELGDYSVTYRTAGILLDVKTLLTTRSKLRVAILDELHGAGIEIVSPTFMNQRQVARGRSFVPRVRGQVGATEQETPEARIFDKAEEAESTALLTEELESLGGRIEELRGAIASAQMPADREPLEAELRSAQQRARLIEQLLETRNNRTK